MIAHAVLRVDPSDTVAAVFNVHRAYFNAEEKMDTFGHLPDCMPADMRTMHVGMLQQSTEWFSTSSCVVGRMS